MKRKIKILTALLCAIFIFSGNVYADIDIAKAPTYTITNKQQINDILQVKSAESNTSLRAQNHERLTNEGYILESVTIQPSPKTEGSVFSTSSSSLSTQIVTLKYYQPTKVAKDYDNKLWQNVNLVINNTAVVMICDNLPFKVVPSVIGLSRDIYNSYGGRNYLKTTTDSTLFIKEVDVIDPSSGRYSVVSVDKLAVATTWLHYGLKADGSPLHVTSSNHFTYTSKNYNNDSMLSTIAKNTYLNGPSTGIWCYFEYYDVTTKTLYK